MDAKEKKLWDRYKKSLDKTELVEFYFNLIERVSNSVCQKYSNAVAEDYVSFGWEGLEDAIDRFDESYGVPFKTFAGKCIMWDITNAIKKELKMYYADKIVFIPLDLSIEDDMTVGDLIPSRENNEDMVDFADFFSSCIKDMSIKHQKIAINKFLKRMTAEQIAENMGINIKGVESALYQVIIPTIKKRYEKLIK
jgi:RNA polymerase sigma factor (sigma-70 family)